MEQKFSVRLVPEEPVTLKDDALGFKAYAQTLADAARESVQPLTIGIFGEWGTGKSSLMRMVAETLKEHEAIVTVECNAWQYQHEEQPLFPLIASVIRRFDDYRSEQSRSLETMLGHLKQAMDTVESTAEETGPVLQVNAAPLDMPDRLESLVGNSQYAKAFQLLNEIEVPRGWKLVVFVDDLDRCSPQRAVRLLESIKLILDQQGFVFVLGVSRDVLEKHLTHLYREVMGIEDFSGASYLEKLVQLPFPIPSHRDRISGLASRLAERIEENELVSLLEMLATVFDYNPRALIRVVNNLIIDRSINENLRAAKKMDQVPLAMFAVSRALQHRWPLVHRVLELSDRQLAENVIKWNQENMPDPNDPDSALSDDESFLVTELRKSLELRNLLKSDVGTQWLKDEAGRVAAAQFVRQHKRETEQPPVGESMAIDVYISYPKKNGDIAEELRKRLADEGFTAFLDRASVGPGEKFQDSIEMSLRTAQALIFLIGKSTPDSTFQRQAAVAMLDRQASGESLLIIPALLPDADPKWLYGDLPELAKYNTVDFSKEDPPFDQSIGEIVHALKRTQQKATK